MRSLLLFDLISDFLISLALVSSVNSLLSEFLIDSSILHVIGQDLSLASLDDLW